MTKVISAEEVAKHNTKEDCWVSCNGKVYDLTKYLKFHPGGMGPITRMAGKDITDIMKDAASHVHSESAYDMMEDFEIGVLGKANEGDEEEYDSTVFSNVMPTLAQQVQATNLVKDYERHKFLDLSKPLLPQMFKSNFTREFYLDQVHRPRHLGEKPAQIFGWAILEPFSKTPWWLIPLVWLPISAYILKIGYDNTSLPVFIALFLFGLVHWTLVEYGIHRFVFHLDDHVPRHTIFYTIHFLMHGVHHLLPMDRLRLVMPPALFCFLATPFALFYFSLFPIGIAATIFGANVLSYVYYDLCHYALHHAELPGFLHALKRHHIEHHYKNYQLGFGITNRFWDDVFGTNFGKDAPIAPSKVKSE